MVIAAAPKLLLVRSIGTLRADSLHFQAIILACTPEHCDNQAYIYKH
jgi:hypothetical protein